jgi:anti-sigma regulatory factor (Ser/Thr protein kinase)
MFPDQHFERVFPAVPQACGEARRFVGAALSDVIGDRLYDAKLATSEYAGNAIKYAAGGKFKVAIDVGDRHVIVHIVDGGSGATIPQVRPEVTPDQEGGRGLPLVVACTDATGCVEASACCCSPHAGGWCCWFRINRPAAPTTLFPACHALEVTS